MSKTNRSFERYFARNLDEARALRPFVVSIFGAGTTGSEVALMLAKAGVGSICIVDPDVVEVQNLHRQTMGAQYLGMNKAVALAETLRAECSSDQDFIAHAGSGESLGDAALLTIIEGSSLVIAATGNDEADRKLNRICRAVGIPLIVPSLFAAANPEYSGDVLVVPWSQANSGPLPTACFECEHPTAIAGESRIGGGLASQAGQALDVWPVACLTAKLAISLMRPTREGGAWLAAELAQGFNQFQVGRLVPTVVPTRTSARRDCGTCSAGRRRLQIPTWRGLLARFPAVSYRLARLSKWRSGPWTDARITVGLIKIAICLLSVFALSGVVYRHAFSLVYAAAVCVVVAGYVLYRN